MHIWCLLLYMRFACGFPAIHLRCICRSRVIHLRLKLVVHLRFVCGATLVHLVYTILCSLLLHSPVYLRMHLFHLRCNRGAVVSWRSRVLVQTCPGAFTVASCCRALVAQSCLNNRSVVALSRNRCAIVLWSYGAVVQYCRSGATVAQLSRGRAATVSQRNQASGDG